MAKIYYYKMTVDNGGAPSVHDGLLSLAICKPEIRRCAQVGDWVMGFGANGFQVAGRRIVGNPLVFVARITGRELAGSYYTDPAYRTRADCIYERRSVRFQRRPGALYHDRPEDLPHDLGEYPDYPKSTVLLSEDFRYFVGGGTTEYHPRLPGLSDVVAGIGRGHRIAYPGTSVDELLRKLQRLLWQQTEECVIEPAVIGRPRASTSTSRAACAPAPRKAKAPRTNC